jgi:amino acid permease
MATYIIVPIAIFILFPLSVQRNLDALKFVSLLSLVALFYTMLVLIIDLPVYYPYFKDKAESKPFYWDFNLFTGCAMVFFSFTCQI